MSVVLVCGGRDFNSGEVIVATLRRLHDERHFLRLIHGGATGADRFAGEWGEIAGLPVVVYEADWAAWGRGAGPRRNQRMLDHGKPSLVVAFPGGRGTADMVRRARAAGVEVIEVA